MINLIITLVGILLLIFGFYFMYLGFLIPPNPIFFFLGLFFAVIGVILLILFGTKVELKPSVPKVDMGKRKTAISKSMDSIRKAKAPKIKPKNEKKQKTPVTKEKTEIAVTKEKKEEKEKPETATVAKEEPIEIIEITEKSKGVLEDEKQEEPKEKLKPEIETVSEEKTISPVEIDEKIKAIRTSEKSRDEVVKTRLNRLKEDHEKSIEDIENLIEERMATFRGAVDKIKSESKQPDIIWSFDAEDVQRTMTDIILKAENKILMMYPWVRNMDVAILKKIMETRGRMIIQEASLDDDASVELIKILMDNNVKIRTMPHVHTVTVVSDENGLIISTDPIYESFEVGMIYKDRRSIGEIERLFEEAWDLSEDVSLEEGL